MKKTYYLAIAAVVLAAIVIFSLLSYSVLLILYAKYFDSHNINVFFITPQGKLIQNVSVSLFAFYPTPNGTVIKQIYQRYNLKYLSIPVSNLTWYAKYWLGTYNYTILIPNGTKVIKKHIIYNASLTIPSLIGFASYYIVNQTNGTITIYTQPFSVRVSPYNITRGIGKMTFKVFLNPIVKRIKINESSSSTPKISLTSVPLIYVYYHLENYLIYPNNSSSLLGPIPLAMVYVTDHNATDYSGGIGFEEGATSTSGLLISFGISIAYGALNFQIAGTLITLNSGSYTNSANAYLGKDVYIYTSDPSACPYFAEIYTEGQIAIVNYSVIVNGEHSKILNSYNVLVHLVTALQIVGKNGAYVPALYTTNGLSPNRLQSFFQGQQFKFFFKVYPYTLNAYGTGSIQVSTSQGNLGGAFLIIEALLQYVFEISGWTFDVVSPYVAISPFTEGALTNYVVISISSYSSNYYFVYYTNTSAQYNIGGFNYTLPTYYFYVNYTS